MEGGRHVGYRRLRVQGGGGQVSRVVCCESQLGGTCLQGGSAGVCLSVAFGRARERSVCNFKQIVCLYICLSFTLVVTSEITLVLGAKTHGMRIYRSSALPDMLS